VCGSRPGNGANRGVQPVRAAQRRHGNEAEIAVARAGSVAVANVSHAGKAGMLGGPGDLGLRLEYLKTNDSMVRLRGTQAKQGKGKEGTAIALTVFFGPIGLIKHGKNADSKKAHRSSLTWTKASSCQHSTKTLNLLEEDIWLRSSD
jgi:hypothetical protein